MQNQTFEDWEALVIDDGSTDGTREVIEKWRHDDKRFSYILNSTGTEGACACRNLGIRRARGQYIIFLDSDDTLLPNALSQRLEIFGKNIDQDFIVTTGAVATKSADTPDLLWNIETNIDLMVRFLNFDSPWQTTGPTWRLVMLKKNDLLWDERLTIWQDIDFHLKALMKRLNFKIFWKAPFDYIVNNTTTDSVSRVGYNSAAKSSGKKYFWKKYLRQAELKEFDKLLLENVVVSVARHFALNREWKESGDILSEAAIYQVMSPKIISNLKLNLKASRFSFSRIKFPDTKFYDKKFFNTIQTIAVGDKNLSPEENE